MRSKVAAATAIGLSFSLVYADLASARTLTDAASAAQEQGQAEAPPPAQGEIRSRNHTCGLVGALVGGIAGLAFGNRRNGGFNTGAALIGGAASALICGAAWRSVHRRDRDEVNRRVAAMTVDPNATTQTYTSAVTGKTYTITAGETTYRQENAEFTTIQEVAAPQMGAKISATPYRVVTPLLNLRATPGAEIGRITGAFYQGDVIESLSETPDGQWVLVGYQNIGYGWVARRFLEPVSGPRDQLLFAVPGPPPAAAAPVRTAARQHRGRAAAEARPTNLVSSQPRRITATPQTRTQTVQAQMVCRAFTVSEGRRSDRNPSCTASRGAVQMG